MAEQLLRNPCIVPTPEIIADGLRTSSAVYLTFLESMKEYGYSLMDWRYYNDGKSWLSKGEYKWITKRGTDKAKPLFWLSIWEGFFKVSFFFSASIRDELLLLPISMQTRDIIASAVPMGKAMKYIPIIVDVSDANQLDDLFAIIQFKKENT